MVTKNIGLRHRSKLERAVTGIASIKIRIWAGSALWRNEARLKIHFLFHAKAGFFTQLRQALGGSETYPDILMAQTDAI